MDSNSVRVGGVHPETGVFAGTFARLELLSVCVRLVGPEFARHGDERELAPQEGDRDEPHGSRSRFCALLAVLAAAVVVTGRGVCVEPVERRADAAPLAAPRLGAFVDGDARDQQADQGVEPPREEHGVADQADEQRAGEVRAEDVLAPLPFCRRRA
jgi:hypothetical protein